ncbi:alpha-galactosidase [Azospirillum rugosum]|uniref:alpha-galactosidase n=1 Tax=Azospirillum rugosum TaxID=416170 RepID=A0ABS4SG88_9PROT|nr:alpha-galactosidase [Azospirillum rugosum]MBP2291586.1 alpha-galactosidase [Azospirillum rugosum]MDQ0524602.1 alpha-galactosidase [Azospirillum rugosum]
MGQRTGGRSGTRAGIARRRLLAGVAAATTLAGLRPRVAAGSTPDGAAPPAPEILRLDGPGTTLLLLRHARGLPEIAWWGSRLPDALDGAWLRDVRAAGRPNNRLDRQVPEATLMPTVGLDVQTTPALVAHRGGLDWTAAFDVREVRRDGSACVVVAQDPVARLSLELHLDLGDDDVLTSRSVLVNEGDSGLVVDRIASGVFLLPAAVADLRALEGRWAREFQETSVPLAREALTIETRGNRTQTHFPGLLAGLPGSGEETGTVFGVQLGWSGGHRLTAERVTDGRVLVTVGELFHPGEVILGAGERLETATAHAAASAEGWSGLSRRFHAHARQKVLRWPGGTMRPRPVTFNTWEGNGFKLDEARLMQQAEAAARLGAERFVLDDGWFRGRRSDRAGLGDWTPDPAIFPNGLAPLARRVNELGMEFGLWVEPEMVNPDSDLLRAHPDWALGVRGRDPVTSRRQLVLDLTRPEVTEYLFEAIDRQLREAPIAYLKWDMNRDLTDAGDAAGRPAYRRQALAVYALMDRLRAAHPALEIESCASGGGRSDLGILGRALRVWPSDCTDALERLDIQRGFLRFLPPEIMGAHVSASPNHQTGRRHSLGFRAAVALFGHMGVELDPLSLPPDQAAELAEWIALHKRLRPLLHGGLHHAGPELDGRRVQGVVAPDGGEAVYLVAQRTSPSAAIPAPLTLPGLDDAQLYRLTLPGPQAVRGYAPSDAQRRLTGEGLVSSGALLRQTGILLPEQRPETALLLHAEAVSSNAR